MLRTLLNGLGAVGNVLDLPGSSVRDVLVGQNPFDQYMTPLHDTNRTSGRDLLRSYGMAGSEDTWGNYLGGMAAETLLDPTNLIPGRAILNSLRGIKAAKTANKGIKAANALSLKQRAMGFMPEEIIPRLAPDVLESPGVPKYFYHGTINDFDKFSNTDNMGHHFGDVWQATDRLTGSGKLPIGNYRLPDRQFFDELNRPFVDDLSPEEYAIKNTAEGANIRKHYLGAERVLPTQDHRSWSAPSVLGELEYSAGRGGMPAIPEDLLAASEHIKRIDAEHGKKLSYGGVPSRDERVLLNEKKNKVQADVAKWLSDSGIDALKYINIAEGIGRPSIMMTNSDKIYKPYIAAALQNDVPVPGYPVKTLGATGLHHMLRQYKGGDRGRK